MYTQRYFVKSYKSTWMFYVFIAAKIWGNSQNFSYCETWWLFLHQFYLSFHTIIILFDASHCETNIIKEWVSL